MLIELVIGDAYRTAFEGVNSQRNTAFQPVWCLHQTGYSDYNAFKFCFP